MVWLLRACLCPSRLPCQQCTQRRTGQLSAAFSLHLLAALLVDTLAASALSEIAVLSLACAPPPPKYSHNRDANLTPKRFSNVRCALDVVAVCSGHTSSKRSKPVLKPSFLNLCLRKSIRRSLRLLGSTYSVPKRSALHRTEVFAQITASIPDHEAGMTRCLKRAQISVHTFGDVLPFLLL